MTREEFIVSARKEIGKNFDYLLKNGATIQECDCDRVGCPRWKIVAPSIIEQEERTVRFPVKLVKRSKLP